VQTILATMLGAERIATLLGRPCPLHHIPCKYICLNCLDLTKRKNRSVQQELHNASWTNHLSGWINTAEQLEEFVSLWLRVQAIELQQDVEDSITWRWTADDCSSARSAYTVQFRGSYTLVNSVAIWKAEAQNKCKVFMWILVQGKLLTAKNCSKGDGRTVNIVCFATAP